MKIANNISFKVRPADTRTDDGVNEGFALFVNENDVPVELILPDGSDSNMFFNPKSDWDRAAVHEMLDAYLDAIAKL